jgi:hypothetical protein
MKEWIGRYSATWASLPVLFCGGYFQNSVSWTICLGGFELWSSWSLPSE